MGVLSVTDNYRKISLASRGVAPDAGAAAYESNSKLRDASPGMFISQNRAESRTRVKARSRALKLGERPKGMKNG